MQDAELSSQKVKFLKYILEIGGESRISEIADKFHITSATVVRSVKELTEEGYLIQKPYHGVFLSVLGDDTARYLIRRHRILTQVFTMVGLSDHDACIQAGAIEHLVPKETLDTICMSLGHPTRTVCGVIEHDIACCGEINEL